MSSWDRVPARGLLVHVVLAAAGQMYRCKEGLLSNLLPKDTWMGPNHKPLGKFHVSLKSGHVCSDTPRPPPQAQDCPGGALPGLRHRPRKSLPRARVLNWPLIYAASIMEGG